MELNQVIPEFELKDQEGRLWSPHKFYGKPLVVFFYPKDFTPGCTKQACSFRDNMDEFLNQGIQVVGISADSVDSHANFAEKYTLDYPILSDENGIVRKKFDVKNSFLGLLPGRETFVFDKEGKLVHKFRSLRPTQHIKSVLTFFNQKNE